MSGIKLTVQLMQNMTAHTGVQRLDLAPILGFGVEYVATSEPSLAIPASNHIDFAVKTTNTWKMLRLRTWEEWARHRDCNSFIR